MLTQIADHAMTIAAGELPLEDRDGGLELAWRIRGTGTVLRAVMNRMLAFALRRRLKPLIESAQSARGQEGAP